MVLFWPKTIGSFLHQRDFKKLTFIVIQTQTCVQLITRTPLNRQFCPHYTLVYLSLKRHFSTLFLVKKSLPSVYILDKRHSGLLIE